MNRVQKKCLVASTTLHGLLLLVLLLSSAFLARPSQQFELPLLDMIPARLVDAALFGGGDPEAQPPAPTPAPTPPTPEPKPIPATEPKPKPVPQPAPTPTPTPKPAVVVPESPKPKPAPTPARPPIQVSKQVRRADSTPTPTPTRPSDQEEAQRRAADQIAQRAVSAASRLSQSLSSKTTIGIPGPGGEAFANYGQVVISIYERNWIKPENIDRTFVVRATVVIARDGKVVSHSITRLSGNRLVDDSVDRVLNRVKFIAPFPDGATDTTRSFNLNFELQPGAFTG
jgi:outer membrane biosynthesis protein TonB